MVSHRSACVMVDAEAAVVGNVADVRSKILSSLVSQFGGRLKEGVMPSGLVKMHLCSDWCPSIVVLRPTGHVMGHF